MNEFSLIKALFTKRGLQIAEDLMSLDIHMRTRMFTFNFLLLLTLTLPLLWGITSSTEDPFITSNVTIALWLLGFLAYVLSIVSQNNVSRALFAYALHASLSLPWPLAFVTFGINSIVMMFEAIYPEILFILLLGGILFIMIMAKNRVHFIKNAIEKIPDNKSLNLNSGQWDSKYDKDLVPKNSPSCLLFILLMVGILVGASILRTLEVDIQLNIIRIVFGFIGYFMMLVILPLGFSWIVVFIEWEKKIGTPIYLV